LQTCVELVAGGSTNDEEDLKGHCYVRSLMASWSASPTFA